MPPTSGTDSNKPGGWKCVFGCTPEALALYRISLGILLMIELVLRFRFLRPFYSDLGTLPLKFLWPKVDILYKSICLHCWSGELLVQQVLLSFQVLFALLVTIGYHSQYMAAISWFLYLSLTLRNTWLNFILDRYFHYLLWYAIFLPTDNKYSITTSKCHENNIDNGMIVSLATIMLKLQVLWLYLDAGFGKWLDPLGGWTFGYDGVPALDSYARHTLGARYLYGILGPFGLRLLTPVVVYVEMLSIPIAIVGSYFANSMFLVYTAIGLICALHIGIAITLRNTVLLSLVACSVCLVFLPLGWTGACGRRNLDHTKSNGRLSLISKILILSMAGGCVWLEVFSESCDQSVKHIWSTVLHNRWNVFVGSEEYVTWEIAPGRLADGSIVDVWGRGSTVDWRLPGSGAPCTSTARPGRWRSFPYLAGIEGEEGDVLWGYLCDEWNREHDASHHPETKLQEFNFFMLQANVLPNMGFSTTRKRLIKSFQCGVEGIGDTVNENETIFGSVVGSTTGGRNDQDEENRHAGGRRGDNDSRGGADSEL